MATASPFEPVKLTWQGDEYVIEADRVMGAIHRVESVITLHELMDYQKRGTAPMARLASAYASVLQYAGCRVRDADVYAGMFAEGAAQAVSDSIDGLLALMVPPQTLQSQGESEPGKPKGGDSSKKRTASRSAR